MIISSFFQDILFQVLPIQDDTSVTKILKKPIFNIVIISYELPNNEEVAMLQQTTSLLLSVVVILRPEVSES